MIWAIIVLSSLAVFLCVIQLLVRLFRVHESSIGLVQCIYIATCDLFRLIALILVYTSFVAYYIPSSSCCWIPQPFLLFIFEPRGMCTRL